jgi:hypothetical protein
VYCIAVEKVPPGFEVTLLPFCLAVAKVVDD